MNACMTLLAASKFLSRCPVTAGLLLPGTALSPANARQTVSVGAHAAVHTCTLGLASDCLLVHCVCVYQMAARMCAHN